MEPILEKFGHFVICRRADGANVELRQSPSEVVFLAFDLTIKRLVELHVLTGTAAMSKAERQAIVDRCKLATQVRGASCLRVLDAGEDADTLYFSSNLSDGEFAADYVARRGALPQVTVFCLMQQFLDELLSTPKIDKLIGVMSLANPLVTTLEDSFLQLRVVNYHLSLKSASPEMAARRVVSECCQLLFLLLTGQVFEGQNPDSFPALTCLPTNLRTHLRTALVDAAHATPQLEKLRDDVREAYAALVSNLQLRTSRKHIVVTEALHPKSLLKDLLLDKVPLDELFKGRFEVAAGEDNTRHPFSIAAVNIKTDQPVMVHLLPPSGIVPRDQYEAVPLQMWRFNPEKQPNILRSLSVWENPAWTFLTEEREPGLTLGRLMAGRMTLNPPEVLILLKQVLTGLEQAQECGVRSIDLHPSNLLLRVGKGGAMQARETERLMEKRIDAWPPFMLKLRTHMTMRSLYEAPLVEMPEGSDVSDYHAAERELRHRGFVGLAIYLLSGERLAGKVPEFGETVSEPLANYLRGCAKADRLPSPSEFVDSFEKLMGQPSSEGRGFAAIMAASGEAGAEVEHVGAISDFDDDIIAGNESMDMDFGGPSRTTALPDYLLTSSSSRKSFNVATVAPEKRTVPGRMGMYVWAACAVLLLVIGKVMFFGGSHAVATAPKPQTSVAHSAPPEPVAAARFSSAPDASARSVSKTTVPVTSSHDTPAPPKPVAVPPEGPVIIKKAIVPNSQEIGDAKKQQSGAAVVSPEVSRNMDVVESDAARFR